MSFSNYVNLFMVKCICECVFQVGTLGDRRDSARDMTLKGKP